MCVKCGKLINCEMKKAKIETNKMIKNWDDNWQKILKKDNQAKGKNTLVGRYIDEPFADGKAVYVIIKESKNTVKIQVCTGLGDDWRIPYWGDEAVIKKDYALQKIKAREYMTKLFGGK